MVVRIIDIETKRVVRELGGFRGRILDIVSGFFLSKTIYFYLMKRRLSPLTQGGS